VVEICDEQSFSKTRRKSTRPETLQKKIPTIRRLIVGEVNKVSIG
jgi:hypothetical protein